MRTFLSSFAWTSVLALSAFGQSRIQEPFSAARGGTDARIAAAARALAAQPRDNRLASDLALAYIQKTRETVDFQFLDRAAKLVDQVLERDPGNYQGLRLRSEIAMERHDFAGVAEYSLEMTRFAPNDPGAWGSLGDASMELGDYARAGSAYGKMLALRPDLASYNRVAWYKFVTGDAKAAISIMQAAVSSGSPSPENIAWCLADLAGIYWKTGKTVEAVAAYRRALEVFPNYFPAFAGLGRIAAAQNRVPEAIDFFRKAQAAVPLPEYAEALEALYKRSGDVRRAGQQRELLDSIEITMRASGEKTNRNLALLYANQNRSLDRAFELIRNEILSRPDVYTYDALAWVQFRKGDLDAAAEASRKALAQGTPEPVFHFHAGMILASRNRETDAREEFRKALNLNAEFDFDQARIAREHLATQLQSDYRKP